MVHNHAREEAGAGTQGSGPRLDRSTVFRPFRHVERSKAWMCEAINKRNKKQPITSVTPENRTWSTAHGLPIRHCAVWALTKLSCSRKAPESTPRFCQGDCGATRKVSLKRQTTNTRGPGIASGLSGVTACEPFMILHRLHVS